MTVDNRGSVRGLRRVAVLIALVLGVHTVAAAPAVAGPTGHETATSSNVVAPIAPDIDSPEYLPLDADEHTSACAEDNQHRGSIGVYGTFTFHSPSPQVVKYLYGFNTNPLPDNVLVPASIGAPVSLRWMPVQDGTTSVTVQAVDADGGRSPIAYCLFSVPTRLAAGEWPLDDAAGATSAADARGNHPAAAGSGVTFGVPGSECADLGAQCQLGRAARLTGDAATSYLATSTSGLIDTSTGFGASAWVRLTDDSVDRVAVSQDGIDAPGFTLGFDADSGRWAFEIAASDSPSPAVWSVTSTAPVMLGEWTHLAAAYDPELTTMTLYVHGDEQPVALRQSVWASQGAVQIGRAVSGSGYTEGWAGDLADVAVFDRVLVSHEVRDLSARPPTSFGYWPLDEATNGNSPEYGGGADLRLHGDSHLYAPDMDEDPFAEPPLVADGHLVLDGVDDWAQTDGPIAVTDRSFTVGVRVRLPGPTCGDTDQAVLSQAGVTASGFVIRCNAASNRWELVLPHQDTTDPASTVIQDNLTYPEWDYFGQHLAVVYDSARQEVRLYVDGYLSATGTAAYTAGWRADGGLQVGRALHNGSFGQYLTGVVDEVRVYAGAADETMIARMSGMAGGPIG
ncbi:MULTISPECIES: LamG-like jellyroll fold domain-containing protein [unclassified Micromonospora]|uniref:LamG domain-containing protein n=1 Tax=unclassified Micromonospora TaxID=2617518 RepID=UPI003A85238F